MEEYPFSASGFSDPLVGAEMFRLLQVGDATFKDPVEFSKLQEIAQFMNGYKDASFVTERALRRNPGQMKPIDAIYSFIRLHKERQSIQENLSKIERELSYYE